MDADFMICVHLHCTGFFMPTIEIVCLNQTKPTDFSDFSFAVWSENKIVSHRGLFLSDFNNLQGCIYHLGNPDLKEEKDGLFFAYELINESISDDDNQDDDILKFNEEFVPQIKEMFIQLLIDSPIGKLIFISDWQFGTKDVKRFEVISNTEFWEYHDSGKLRFNALYKIEG
jgi:hypothetical protein